MRQDLKQGAYYFVSNGEIAVPTIKRYGNARLLTFDEKHIFLHWRDNYNTRGDFSTELMKFSSTETQDITKVWVLDEGDKIERNALRRKYGLMPIS